MKVFAPVTIGSMIPLLTMPSNELIASALMNAAQVNDLYELNLFLELLYYFSYHKDERVEYGGFQGEVRLGVTTFK